MQDSSKLARAIHGPLACRVSTLPGVSPAPGVNTVLLQPGERNCSSWAIRCVRMFAVGAGAGIQPCATP